MGLFKKAPLAVGDVFYADKLLIIFIFFGKLKSVE